MKKRIVIMRSGFIMLLFLAAVLIVSGCKDNSTQPTTGGGTSNPPDNEIWMQGSSYNPKTKTITAGTTITWVNKDPTNHTVTSGTPGSPNALFDSGTIGSGGNFVHTFSTAGTFNYYCRIHQDIMTGTIIVQ